MKSHNSLILVCILLLSVTLFVSCGKEEAEKTTTGQAKLEWLTSYEEALSRAMKKNIPIMIDFYADWCGYCHKLDSDTYSNAEVVSLAKGFISLKIDADIEKAITSRYRIMGLPTIVFIDPKGDELHRVVGYLPPGRFAGEMNRALEAFRNKTGAR